MYLKQLKHASTILFPLYLSAVFFVDAALAAPPQAAASSAATPATSSAQAEPFSIKWSFVADPPPNPQIMRNVTDPVVSNNVLYFGDDIGEIRALNAKDGNRIWNVNIDQARIYALATDGQRLYLNSTNGIMALDCVNGKTAWNFPIRSGASTSGCALWLPTESLFVGGGDGLIYALDRRTGEKTWSHSVLDDAPPDPPGFDGARARLTDSPARPTGIATDGKLVFQSIFDQCRVIALDARTGKQKWSFQTQGWIGVTPDFNDDFVVIGSQDQKLYCLKKETGERVWDFTTKNRIESSPLIVGKNVLIASCDGNLYCISIATGQEVWHFATDRAPGAIYSKPLLLNDTLCFAAGEGQVYALSTSGQLLWKLRPSPGSELFTSPTTDGTRIYLHSRPHSTGGRRGGAPPEGESSIIALGK